MLDKARIGTSPSMQRPPTTRRPSSNGSAGHEIADLIGLLTEEECLAPGYFVDPDWSVRDLIAHLTAWFAEARPQLLDIADQRLRAARLRCRRPKRRDARGLWTASRGRGVGRASMAGLDARGVVRVPRARRDGDRMDPQGRRRALRRACPAPSGVGRRSHPHARSARRRTLGLVGGRRLFSHDTPNEPTSTLMPPDRYGDA